MPPLTPNQKTSRITHKEKAKTKPSSTRRSDHEASRVSAERSKAAKLFDLAYYPE